ncbi:MAG TPA: hypothetical protein VFQ92_11150, partial [Blastocatellia bacterium]|nr:hypothetical protein [Blastocatellia bacterium]
MSRRITIPKIDLRTASDLLLQLRAMVPHYTVEWPAKDEDDPGVGLLKIFSFIAEGVISRLNRAPERNFLSFLDMLGIRLLPATPARAPVRFLVAPGTEDEFLVPRGTQVSAPPAEGRPDELPFETIESLWAIPSSLTALVAVDPESDRIYKPPPGFLARSLSAAELPPMHITAFSAAGSKSIQLDLPGQLQEDDFLRIELLLDRAGSGEECIPATGPGQSRVIDHLEVAEVKGQIVTLKDPIVRDYVEGTLVRKLTRFELYEGKNFQEHVLYLAHGEYFDIKSEALIELLIEHAPGSASNLQPLNIVWEFFGELAKEEGWHPFEIELDGSAGLSRDGRLILSKPQGEIKEIAINGNETRWIRARLDEPLPSTPPRSLPKIEAITLTVSSQADGIQADQAFHNDTPLTLNREFNPFGPEPRIFDRFYIASEEAFSKPGADVILNIDLDFTDLLAAPAAIIHGGKIRSFAHGAAGRLVEFQIDPTAQTAAFSAVNHQTPVDTRITAGSIPAVVNDVNQTRLGAFVKADDGKLYLRFIMGEAVAGWQWIDLQAPQGNLAFDPAAVRNNGQWQVYVVADGQVYSKVINPLAPNAQVGWTPHPGVTAASSPFAQAEVIGNAVVTRVIVTDDKGDTYVFDGANWVNMTPKDSNGVSLERYVASKNARPHGLIYADSSNNPQVRIFLRNKSDELVFFDTEGGLDNLGAPAGVRLDSNPYVSSSDAGTRVFVRGSDNRLWEIDLNVRQWRPHLNPSEFNLAGDPFALTYRAGPGIQADFVSVFSTSDKNSLLEFRVSRDVNSGDLQAGPREIILLEDPVDFTVGTYYVEITSGPATGEVRKILSGLSADRFAVLEKALPEITTSQTEYRLFEQIEEGDIQNATDNTVELEQNTIAQDTHFVYAKEQLRKIDGLQGDTATLTEDWDEVPDPGDSYVILDLISGPIAKKARDEAAKSAVLDVTASGEDNAYEDLFLTITEGEGQSPEARLIASYARATKSVVMVEDFPLSPVKGSSYRITVGRLPEGWLVYSDPDQTELRPELSWEYWNGSGWVSLPVQIDGTNNFLVPGKLTLKLPEDIAKTEVVGQESYWIRARIVGGDYGRELFFLDKNNQLKIRKNPIRPPLIKSLSISYAVTERKQPQFCLTFNNLGYLDQTAANAAPDKHYFPYLPLPDTERALHFGFDKKFEGGPVRLYLAASELIVDDRNRPRLAWEFASENVWMPLAAEDRTDAFTKPEIVTWTVPGDFQNRQQFGEALYWIRARLTEGGWSASPLLSGVFLNTVETIQARTVLNEILGSSTGARNERFRFRQLPVLEGEELRVREVLTEEERKELISAEGRDSVLDFRDQEGRVLETWVRWKEVPEFF